MELTLHTGVRDLPGIGEARAARLEKLGLATAEDLLRYFPRDYEDRRSSCTIDAAPVGVPSCVTAMVAEAPRHSYIRKGLELTKVRVVDAHSSMELTFFNQSYVKNALVPGETYVFYGAAEGLGPRRQMTNPIFESEGRVRFTGRIMPVYPLTAGSPTTCWPGSPSGVPRPVPMRCPRSCPLPCGRPTLWPLPPSPIRTSTFPLQKRHWTWPGGDSFLKSSSPSPAGSLSCGSGGRPAAAPCSLRMRCRTSMPCSPSP